MNFTRTFLHRLDPEWIHEFTVKQCATVLNNPVSLKMVEMMFGFENPQLHRTIGNLEFPNPIGMAAGYDKDGVATETLQAMGFGHVEVGTVTPKPQPGNEKPRLYRLKEDDGIINRMGFNNHGLDALVNSLSGKTHKIPVGVNLGKNKQTPVESAVNDYTIGIQKAWKVADYFAINISSPNTEHLRDIQQESYLTPFIREIIDTRNEMERKTASRKQVWLKIAPDLNDEELETICGIVLDEGVDALIVSNTTISRPDQLKSANKVQSGGLSGRPLFQLSNAILKKVEGYTNGKIPLIAVGGIFSADDVKMKLDLGASLVQLYTGLIYEGPGLIKKIKKGLIR